MASAHFCVDCGARWLTEHKDGCPRKRQHHPHVVEGDCTGLPMPPLGEPPEFPQWHGPQLDEAMNSGPQPGAMGICETALRSRMNDVIDQQLDAQIEHLEELAKTMRAERPDASDDEIMMVSIRAILGATWSHGIATGLALRDIPQRLSEEADR